MLTPVRACAKSVNHTPSFRRRPESRLRTGHAVTGVSDFAQALHSRIRYGAGSARRHLLLAWDKLVPTGYYSKADWENQYFAKLFHFQASASQSDHPLASVSEDDARSLSWADESVDLFLLMGPLYHLIVREDRLAALSEASRVLRNEGILFATAVNRFASLVDDLMDGYIDDPDFITILYRD